MFPAQMLMERSNRCYPAPAGRVAVLEEEGVVSADPISREDSESEVEAVNGLNMRLLRQ